MVFMGWFVVVAVALSVIGVQQLMKNLNEPADPQAFAEEDHLHALKYELRNEWLTETEQQVYRLLNDVAGQDAVVLIHVQLSRLIAVPHTTPHDRHHRKRIHGRSVPFVLCEPVTVRPLACIDVRRSLETARQLEERLFYRSILDSAGIPWLTIADDQTVTPAELRHRLESVMGPLVV